MENNTMILTDILIENYLTNEQIKKVLLKVFNVQREKIHLINECEDFPSKNTKLVICQKTRYAQGFSLMLSIYLFGKISETQYDLDSMWSGDVVDMLK